jgi:rhamnosyl/mannosyltransferase
VVNRLRVLCFGRFYDEIPGGMQRHVEHLFASLQGQVDYVHLVPSRNWTAARFALCGFPVVRTPSLNLDGSLALSPELVTEAIRLHRKYRFDVVHIHFPDPMSHIASLALPRSVKRIITWHADISRQKNFLAIYRPLLRRALKSADAVVVPTPAHIHSSPELSRLTDGSRIHVIPFGFDLAPFLRESPVAETARARFPGKRIFALGRHVYYKGFDVLIDAMAVVDPDAQLLLGGTGPLTEALRARARERGVVNRVHFLGLIAEHDLPGYYQACDVFCLPANSPAEAFGIVQVEAMASGKPVVSTQLNNGVSYVNVHGQTGLLVPPNDAPALAGAINGLLADSSLRKTMGVRARERVIEEFSLEKMGSKTLELYHYVCGT